ncbi:MAG TPA: GNAT family N-acetyltransferase [Candidatus Eisenbacteria bacterium]|nr:GNAT family N-acetyltransferase [Candidatus Eisenbacteria bacterium]
MGRDDVSPLDAADEEAAAAAASLLSRELGEGLYRPEWLREDAASAAAHVLLARSPALVGAAVARLLTADDSGYYRAFGAPALELFTGSVGSFEAFAVEPDHRRRGIGTRLATASLDWMRERGCDSAVTVAWQSRRSGTSARLFRHLGMAEGPTVERFYLEESLRDGWACPVCGGPCTCSATLFTLRPVVPGGGSR